MKKIAIVDYACHPFTLDLAVSLATKSVKVYYFFSLNIDLTKGLYKSVKKKNLKIIPILTKNIPKHNFFI